MHLSIFREWNKNTGSDKEIPSQELQTTIIEQQKAVVQQQETY